MGQFAGDRVGGEVAVCVAQALWLGEAGGEGEAEGEGGGLAVGVPARGLPVALGGALALAVPLPPLALRVAAREGVGGALALALPVPRCEEDCVGVGVTV